MTGAAGAGPAGPRVLAVVGPTATGKTALALDLARRLGGEVVGADAYQVYRRMDIGTAKPTAAELGGQPYHLLDVADPDEGFDAHRYVELADRAIADVVGRGRVPIVAGGTGLYVRALVRGLADMPGRDPGLRAELEDEARRKGPEALHRRLALVDPGYAGRVGPRDVVRIVRGLEVHAGSGRTITEVHEAHARAPDRLAALWLGLDPGREALRERVERRTAALFEAGFVDEVRGLRARGYGPELPSMKALGYRAVHRLIDGEIDEAEARRLTTRDTMRYARRQRTWFRAEPAVGWVDPEREDLVQRARAFLDG